MITLEDVQKMRTAGIQFLIEPITVWGGGYHLLLSPEEVLEYIDNRDAVIAKHLGVSEEQYGLWIQSEGSVFCEATTKSGRRCRRRVAGTRSQLDLQDWIKALERGGYCSLHGVAL